GGAVHDVLWGASVSERAVARRPEAEGAGVVRQRDHGGGRASAVGVATVAAHRVGPGAVCAASGGGADDSRGRRARGCERAVAAGRAGERAAEALSGPQSAGAVKRARAASSSGPSRRANRNVPWSTSRASAALVRTSRSVSPPR